MSDPFEAVQEEARHSLLEVSAQLSRWQALRGSSSPSELAEAASLHKAAARTLDELKLDLHDLQQTVDIASRDPAKYKLTPQDIENRRKSVFQMQSDAEAAQAELSCSDSGGGNASSKKIERKGLLERKCSQSENAEHLGSQGSSALPSASSKNWAMRAENSSVINSHQEQQQEQLEMQDVELNGLGETVGRLGKMGRVRISPAQMWGRRGRRGAYPASCTLCTPWVACVRWSQATIPHLYALMADYER